MCCGTSSRLRFLMKFVNPIITLGTALLVCVSGSALQAQHRPQVNAGSAAVSAGEIPPGPPFSKGGVRKPPLLKPVLRPVEGRAAQSAGEFRRTEVSLLPSDNLVTMNFQDIDIPVLTQFISEITQRNFIVDEKVRGKVTVISPTKVTPEEAYAIFQSVLQVKGFTTVLSGRVVKIVPSKDA